MSKFESLMDKLMREAEAAGQFRNLPGAGKPLHLDDDSHVPEELRLGFRVLKNAGCVPSWIELQQQIREEQRRLAQWLEGVRHRWPTLAEAEQAQLQAEYEQRVKELNKQITTYNLTAPAAVGQLPLLSGGAPGTPAALL